MPKITITDGSSTIRDVTAYYDWSQNPFSYSETYDRHRGRSKTAEVKLLKVDASLVTPQEDNVLKIYSDSAGTKLIFGGVITRVVPSVKGHDGSLWIVDYQIDAEGYDPRTLSYREVVDYQRIGTSSGRVIVDLLSTYAPWINTTNIEITNSPVLRSIRIARKSLDAVIQDISEKTDWTFYINDNAEAFFNSPQNLPLNWGITEGIQPNYFPEFDHESLSIEKNTKDVCNDYTIIGGETKGPKAVELFTFNGQDAVRPLAGIPYGLDSIIQFFDSHDNSSIDTVHWYENDTGNKITEASGRLQINSGVSNTGILVLKNLFSRDDNIEFRLSEFEITSFASGKATVGIHNGTQGTTATDFLHALEFDQSSGSLRTREGATVTTFGSIPIGVGIYSVRIRIKASGGAIYFIQGGRTGTPKEYGELGSKVWIKVTETSADTTALLSIALRFDTAIGCTVIRTKVSTDINISVVLLSGGKLGSGSPVAADTVLMCGLQQSLDYEVDCFIGIEKDNPFLSFFTDNKPLGNVRLTYWVTDTGVRERVYSTSSKSTVDARSALSGDDGTRSCSISRIDTVKDAQDARNLLVSVLGDNAQYRGGFSTHSFVLDELGLRYALNVSLDTPKGSWRLNETSGTVVYDYSGYGHNGTYNGTPLLGEGSVFTNGLEFDPSVYFDGTNGEYISVPSHADNSIGDIITLEAWVMIDGTVAGLRAIISKDDNYILYKTSTHKLGFSGAFTSGVIAESASAIPSGIHHVAAVKSGVNAYLYIDGVDVTVLSVNQTLVANSNVLGIGGTSGGFSCWQGLLGPVAIYNTALSAARILSHYQSGSSLLTYVGDKPICGRRIMVNLPNTWGYPEFSEVITGVKALDIGIGIKYDIQFGEGDVTFERMLLHIRNTSLIDIVDDESAAIDPESEEYATAGTSRVSPPELVSAVYDDSSGLAVTWAAATGASNYELRDNVFRGQGQGGTLVYQLGAGTSYSISVANIKSIHKKRSFILFVWSKTSGGQYSKYPLIITVENPAPIPQPIKDIVSQNGIEISTRFEDEKESDILASGRRHQRATNRNMVTGLVTTDVSKTAENTDFTAAEDTTYYVRYGLRDEYTDSFGDIVYSGIREIKSGRAIVPISDGVYQYINDLAPSSAPSAVGHTFVLEIPGATFSLRINWSYTPGTYKATHFGIIIKFGGGTPTTSDYFYIIEANKLEFTYYGLYDGTYSVGVFAMAVTKSGMTRSATIATELNFSSGLSGDLAINVAAGDVIAIGVSGYGPSSQIIQIGGGSATCYLRAGTCYLGTHLVLETNNTYKIGSSSSDQLLALYSQSIYRNGTEIASVFAAISHTHAKADIPSAVAYEDESNTFSQSQIFNSSVNMTSGTMLVKTTSQSGIPSMTAGETRLWVDTDDSTVWVVYYDGANHFKTQLVIV